MLKLYRPKLIMRKDSHLRPSIAEKGAKSTDELFLSAGRAISQWEI